MKNTLYKFYPIAEVDLDKLEDTQEYGFEFDSGLMSSMPGKVLKYMYKEKIKSILLPVEQKLFMSDSDIERYWTRKNCFGHYHEGLVSGAKWMRDEFVNTQKALSGQQFLEEWKNKM